MLPGPIYQYHHLSTSSGHTNQPSTLSGYINHLSLVPGLVYHRISINIVGIGVYQPSINTIREHQPYMYQCCPVSPSHLSVFSGFPNHPSIFPGHHYIDQYHRGFTANHLSTISGLTNHPSMTPGLTKHLYINNTVGGSSINHLLILSWAHHQSPRYITSSRTVYLSIAAGR